MVPGQPREKVCETLFQQKKRGHDGVHLSSQLWWEVYKRRIAVQSGLGKKGDPISKEGVTQVLGM
jgi:hypothetical protein